MESSKLRQVLCVQLEEKGSGDRECPAFRSFAFLVATLMISGCTNSNNIGMGIPGQVNSQKWRAVRIAARQPEGFHFLGTGFGLVRGGKVFVITNEHTLQKAHERYGAGTEIWVDFQPPVHAHQSQLMATDGLHDLAILSTDVAFEGEGQEQVTNAMAGDPVMAIGYDDQHNQQHEPLVSRGTVKLTAPYALKEKALITSGVYPGPTAPAIVISGVNCASGASGSPVFDQRGRIVGYLKGRLDTGDCLAISINRALELLK